MILAFYSEASGSGKDTAADLAAKHLRERGYVVERDAFAWDGKVVCADALGIQGTREEKVVEIDRLKLSKTGAVFYQAAREDGRVYHAPCVTGRDFIIGLLGSPGKGNGIRGLDEEFWTRQVVNRAAFTDADFTIVSDMRFLEEAKSVRGVDGRVVEIVRGENLGTFNEQRLPHDLVDHVIQNDGTLYELELRVCAYVESLLFERLAEA